MVASRTHNPMPGHAQFAGVLPIQSLDRDCGGPITLRVAGEAHDITDVGHLHALVRGLLGEVTHAKQAVWVRRAMAGWVFCQLIEGPGPLATSDCVARQFAINANTVRAWMRLARAVVHAPSGEVDWDLVRQKLTDRDRERSRRAVTARQKAAVQRAASTPLIERSQADVEMAVGTRPESEPAVTGVTDAEQSAGIDINDGELVFGPQLGFDALYDAACEVRASIVEVEPEQVAGWLRDGELRMSRQVAAVLGVDLDELLQDTDDERQRAGGDGPSDHTAG